MSAARASYPVGLVLVAIVLASTYAFNKERTSQAPTISFVTAPNVLPRGEPAVNYSPLVAIQYSGLEAGKFVINVHLLETEPPDDFNCGCTVGTQFWCPAVFNIDNQQGTNSSGVIFDARITDIVNRQGFLWKAELFKETAPGTTVLLSEALRPAASTPNHPPVLNPIGKKTVSAGQSLDFTISASEPVTFSAQNLPPGATLNSAGQFHWQPSTPGTFSQIAFIATQAGSTPLSDAELIDIQVDPPQQPGTLAFSTNSNSTGEGGPVVLFVNRTNGSGGTVSVAYSTANGTATAGADYTAVPNGLLTFANGEVTKSIRLDITNDAANESNENFQVTLSSPTGGATLGSPSQTNVTIFDDDTPSAAGQWGAVGTWPTVPIHMHLLPSGKVMFWDRIADEHNMGADVIPRLWDPLNGSFTSLPLAGWNIFCTGHNIMADGRVFVAGGHIHNNFEGVETAAIYDPQTNAWTGLPNMNGGRWYPTTTILPNGDVLVISGTQHEGDINRIPQVWQVNSGSWRDLANAQMGQYPGWPDLYPYSYVAPNGKIFIAGPQKTARYLDTAGSGAWTDVANSSLCYRDYGSSVMYNDGKVLIVGGNPRDNCDPNIPRPIFPSASAEVIDLNAPTPSWRPVSSMAIGRRHLNTTILPDGKVLITGGSSGPGHDDATGAVFFAELWDPSTETFVPLASHKRYRGYHSNALLLPDARVLVAGGGHPNPDGGFAENNAEIYSPPYLFKGTRPSITGAPTVVGYGQTFTVQTPEAASIANVNWIRLGSTTHAFNESQRINRLTFSQGAGGLNVTSPASPVLCPPGHYMLFILNSNGVPSVARIVQIAQNPGTSLQLLLEEAHGGTNLAAALDFPTFLRDPFLVINESNFLAPVFDRNTRVTIFVRNLELAAAEPASSVTVQLTDSGNATQTIAAEDVRRVPGFDFSQVMFRLPSSLPAGNCAIKVIAKGQTSNTAVIRIRVP